MEYLISNKRRVRSNKYNSSVFIICYCERKETVYSSQVLLLLVNILVQTRHCFFVQVMYLEGNRTEIVLFSKSQGEIEKFKLYSLQAGRYLNLGYQKR